MLLGFFLLGFLGIFFFETYLNKKYPSKHRSSKVEDALRAKRQLSSQGHGLKAKNVLGSRENDLAVFFEQILPLEFTQRPWYKKFWLKTLERHPYIGYMAPAEGRLNYRSKKWICMCFELLNIVFVDAIFAPLVAPDAEVCEKFTTATDCLKPSSIDLIDSLCSWNSEDKACEFREIDQNMGVVIITCLMIKILEHPLMTLCEYLVDQVGSLRWEEEKIHIEELIEQKPHEAPSIAVESPRLRQNSVAKVAPLPIAVRSVSVKDDVRINICHPAMTTA